MMTTGQSTTIAISATAGPTQSNGANKWPARRPNDARRRLDAAVFAVGLAVTVSGMAPLSLLLGNVAWPQRSTT
jgi:hypothetical protein